MKFIFPDSTDVIAPNYDFDREKHVVDRVRLRGELYPHEVFNRPPYDGMLISLAIVNSRYSLAQKQRLFRDGARKFLRLDKPKFKDHLIYGDCGAFSYRGNKIPPMTNDEVIDFYTKLRVNVGITLDHIIFDFERDDKYLPGELKIKEDWLKRQHITIENAAYFWALYKKKELNFKPLGVAHGWNAKSYIESIKALEKIGYKYICLGGLVPLKTADLHFLLERISKAKRKGTTLHLLGIGRCENIKEFKNYDVATFDSTAPLLKAFMDDKHNYYSTKEGEKPYTAIRVPQVHGNNELRKRVQSGEVDQDALQTQERHVIKLLKNYDQGKGKMETLLEAIHEYDVMIKGSCRHLESYRRILTEQPWKKCKCPLCKKMGIHIVIFRGAERNRSRGFCNLNKFYKRFEKRRRNGS